MRSLVSSAENSSARTSAAVERKFCHAVLSNTLCCSRARRSYRLNGPTTVGNAKPGIAVPSTPMAARLNRSDVADASAKRRGRRSLRATPRTPRDCLVSAAASIPPRLKSRPRSMASRNDSVPEKGRRLAPGTAPRNAPWTSTRGLRVFTPVVGPGTTVSVAVTPPGVDPRPESGSSSGTGPGGGGDDTCCAVAAAARPKISSSPAHTCRGLDSGDEDMRTLLLEKYVVSALRRTLGSPASLHAPAKPDTTMTWSTQLLTESPHADRHEHDGEQRQCQDVWPQIDESAPFDERCARDHAVVIHRVHGGEGPHP